MARRSLSEFFSYFDKHSRDVAYSQPSGYRTESWTYRDVAETAARVARELESRSISPGDRVLILGPNSAEWAAAFWGSVLSGAVIVPMDWAAAQDFIERVARQVDAKLIFAARDRSTFSIPTPVLILEDLRAAVAQHPAGTPGARYPSPPLDRAAIAEIVFTSGTTGEPKGVVLTHGNILANLEPIEEGILPYLKYERLFHPIRFLNLLPLSHVFGQFLGLFLPAVMGGKVLFQESLSPAVVARTIRHERVSVLVAVPRMLESLRNKIERDYADAGRADWLLNQRALAVKENRWARWWRFRKIRLQFGWKFAAMISGGATLPHETEEFWDQLGFAVIQGYGMTETAALVSLNHPFHRGKGSIGKVLPGNDVKLDANGEILVRGESVSSGYWRGAGIEPAGNAQGEWLHTGDIGELDADGNLYFKGRRKNVIVTSAGMNIYPEDLEAALRHQPEIKDCIVLPLNRGGNVDSAPTAVLILRQPNADAAAAVARANESLAEFQRMRHWFVWPDADFPRTPTGKPRVDVISARIAAPENHAKDPQGIADLIAKFSARPAAGSATPDAAGVSTDKNAPPQAARLEGDLGLSSLDRVELLSALEDRYQVSINESELTPNSTVADLTRLLQQNEPHGPQHYYPRWPERWPVTWIRDVIYTLLTWPATHILAHPRVRGRENLRGIRGPLFIVSNHVTDYDIGFILAALPPRYRYHLATGMGGERLRGMRNPPPERGFWGGNLDRLNAFLVTALFNVFPLPRLSGFRESFQYAGESVDRGFSILVFPEGLETIDGSLLEFRGGAGLLAKNLGIPVLPMRIDGLFAARERHKAYVGPNRVRVSIGQPIHFPANLSPDEISHQLQQSVESLAWPGEK
jgi:long-chain acyl-CoA synthetase